MKPVLVVTAQCSGEMGNRSVRGLVFSSNDDFMNDVCVDEGTHAYVMYVMFNDDIDDDIDDDIVVV